jgi:peptide deformylase
MYKIVTIPNDVLTTQVKPVEKIDARIKKIVKEMEKTLLAQVDPIGVGLAATQVGLSLSLFLMKPTLKAKIEAFINPKILALETKPALKTTRKKNRESFEGCLSIPKIWSPIVRPDRVHLEYQTLTGEIKQEWFTGFKAVIIQHEVDHLHGVLFTQRAVEQKAIVYEERDGELKKIKTIEVS